MTDLVTQTSNLATRVGTQFKTIAGLRGDLTSLTTTAKGNLVAAINEVNAKPSGGGDNGVQINDGTPSTTTTYSGTHIDDQIATAVSNLINGAPAAYDTLKEIADYIASDQTAASGVTTALGLRVAVDASQTFTSAQKAQARSNIAVYGTDDIGDVSTDFVAIFNAALV